MCATLSFCDWTEDRFDIEDRRSVEGFEVGYKNPKAIDGEDLNSVKTDRVGSVR